MEEAGITTERSVRKPGPATCTLRMTRFPISPIRSLPSCSSDNRCVHDILNESSSEIPKELALRSENLFIHSFIEYPILFCPTLPTIILLYTLRPTSHRLHFALLHFMIQELLRLISRFSGMTPIQPILPIHDNIVANITNVRSISPIRFDIDILKSPIETRVGFTAVNFDDSFTICVSGKVLEVDIGPFECTCIWV
jgi:hypothetical protein